MLAAGIAARHAQSKSEGVEAGPADSDPPALEDGDVQPRGSSN
jgi:hypothetical protein